MSEYYEKHIPEQCQHDYNNPVRKGRAWYVCPKCGKDITLELVLIYELDNDI